MNFWYQHRCSYPRTSLVEMRLKICSKEKRLSLVHLSLSLLDVIQRWWVSLLDIKHKWWLSPSLLYQLMQGWSTSANQRNQIAQMTWRPLFGWGKTSGSQETKSDTCKGWGRCPEADFMIVLNPRENPTNPDIHNFTVFRVWKGGLYHAELI